VPVLVLSTAALWWLTGTVSRLALFTLAMVVFFGALTAWFNDERFFKMKTTIVYGGFAAILAAGLWRGTSLLKWVLGSALPLRDAGWMILTRRLAAMFAALAIGNEIVWRTLSTDAWVKIETFGFPLALFVFLWVQILALQGHIEEDKLPGARRD
jgi:intracellular septation protein